MEKLKCYFLFVWILHFHYYTLKEGIHALLYNVFVNIKSCSKIQETTIV